MTFQTYLRQLAKPMHSQISAPMLRSRKNEENVSAFKALGWLDRLLAIWILLAIIIGILLGNFVPSTGPALQHGKFVGVSVPIGKLRRGEPL